MSSTEQDAPLLGRAARRIELARRSLVAAAFDLQAVGALEAAEVVADEVAVVDQLAAEMHELAPKPAPHVEAA